MVGDFVVYLMFLIIFGFFFLIILLGMLIPCCKKLIKEEYEEIKRDLFFNDVIMFINASWLKLSITGGKQIKLLFKDNKYVTQE